MQFVGDAGECGGEVLARANFGVAASRFLRDARETGIGEIRREHRLETAAAGTGGIRSRPGCAYRQRRSLPRRCERDR